MAPNVSLLKFARAIQKCFHRVSASLKLLPDIEECKITCIWVSCEKGRGGGGGCMPTAPGSAPDCLKAVCMTFPSFLPKQFCQASSSQQLGQGYILRKNL